MDAVEVTPLQVHAAQIAADAVRDQIAWQIAGPDRGRHAREEDDQDECKAGHVTPISLRVEGKEKNSPGKGRSSSQRRARQRDAFETRAVERGVVQAASAKLGV